MKPVRMSSLLNFLNSMRFSDRPCLPRFGRQQYKFVISLLLLMNGVAYSELTASLAPQTKVKPAASTVLTVPKLPMKTSLADPVPEMVKTEITYETTLEPVIEIDIPTLLRVAEGSSLDVAIAKNQTSQAKWNMIASLGSLLPSGSMYNYYERYRGADIFIGARPFKSDRDTYQTRYSASYSIQLGGQDIFNAQANRYVMNRMRRMTQQTYSQVISDLLGQYYAYLRDISGVNVAKEAVHQSEVQLRLSESRFRTGFTTKLDVTQARTLLADKQGDLVRAENQKLATEYGLANALKLSVGVRIKPGDTELKPLQLVDSHLTIQKLFQIALANRPDVKALVDNINEARARYAATRAELFPTVTVSGYKRKVGPQNQLQPSHEAFASISYDATRGLGLPVLAQMRHDKLRVQEAVLQQEKQLLQIQKEISETYLTVDLNKEQIKYMAQKVQAAEEAFKITRHRRMNGTGINLEVVQAGKDLADARQEYYSSVMNYNIAQLRLLFQIGQLTPQRVLASLVIN